jgi:hypothetical protein
VCALREEIHGHIAEMKEKEVVSDASIEFPALAILITKKSPDNTTKYRFCVDFRERDHLEDTGVDGRIILRWIFRK